MGQGIQVSVLAPGWRDAMEPERVLEAGVGVCLVSAMPCGASSSGTESKVVPQMGQHLRPHALADPPEPRRIPGLDGGDLSGADHGRRRQPGAGQLVERDIAGPATVSRARDHQHPDQAETGVASRDIAIGDHQRRSELPCGAVGLGERNLDDVALAKDRHRRRHRPAKATR
jgi:hypothetical protein